ncbi:MAG: DUF885 domain-containing protein, partial [Pseudomonadota bacterium]
MIIRLALLGTTALSLAACSSAYGQEVASAPAAPQAVAGETAETPQSERDRLYAIFAAADEAELELSPLSAIFRGQYENADRIGDFYSDELDAKAEKLAQDNLAALEGIDTAKLSQTDKLAYEVFALNQRETLSNYEPEIAAATRPRPMNHFFGIHTFYPTFESGSGAAPFKTVKDYENAASRHADYVRIIERAIGRFRDGMESGVLETRLTTENMIEQLDTQIEQPLEESPYWGPIKAFPEDFSDTDKARLEADFRTSIAGIYAVNTRLRDFLRDEYLPVARTSVGLSDMKGGDVLYAKLIRDTTTLPLTADELHELGKSEVARIQGEMEEVKELMGFEGTLSEFFTYLRTDPKFTPESREWLTEEYYRIGKVVDEKIGDYFSLLPKSELEIRPYEPFREKFQAGGSYQSGSPDGERPGVFYFNAYDLPSRPITQNVTLYLHEGAPGHHFQISIAQENEGLPAFMRFGGTTAYVEGWALYSETGSRCSAQSRRSHRSRP